MELLKNQSTKIPSSFENFPLVEKFIDKVCSDYYIDEECYGNILIAITEAVNNAIAHGNKSNPSKFVEISFKPYLKELIFNIKDEGTGFDYHNLPDPTSPKNVEKLNGRGIFLMKHLADEVQFNEKGNEVEISFSDCLN